jgi:phosphoribosylformimino-5-aminoimidazole carboxamide ribotide isomerase
MQLFPSIDVRAGRVVRLMQGDYQQETVYGDDPVAVARRFEAAGAAWIHMVDLDAALTGEPTNREVIAEAARAVAVPVQAGGGVVDGSLLELGVRRVVLGTAAVRDPEVVADLAARYPGRIAVGVDARSGEVAVRGWTEGSGVAVAEMLARFAGSGVAAFVVTDIGRDGMLAGPDVDGLRAVLGVTTVDVVASGGVSSTDDLRRLAALEVDGRRLAGVIVGRAIYEGLFTVEEAIATCTASV